MNLEANTPRNRNPLVTRMALGMIVVSLSLGAQSILASPQEGADSPPPQPPSSFVDDFLLIEQTYSSKYLRLAKAIPEKDYGWRPAEGVRSVREVLQHIIQTNQGLIQGFDGVLPAGIDGDPNDVADRDRLVEMLDTSFSTLRELTKGLAGAPASTPLEAANGRATNLGITVLAHTEHYGEHLGQLIAYARSVGVKPPWSR